MSLVQYDSFYQEMVLEDPGTEWVDEEEWFHLRPTHFSLSFQFIFYVSRFDMEIWSCHSNEFLKNPFLEKSSTNFDKIYNGMCTVFTFSYFFLLYYILVPT